MNYTQHQHIQDWLNQHYHEILGVEYSKILETYLDSLPWDPSRVQWANIPHISVEMPETPGVDFLRACKSSPLGGHEFSMIMYNGAENAILCRSEEALLDLDLLYARAPGPRYFCGVDRVGEEFLVCAQDFAEYDLPGITFRMDG